MISGDQQGLRVSQHVRDNAPLTVWLALLFAFADVQFMQWTSYVMRPALVVLAFVADLVLFLGVAAGAWAILVVCKALFGRFPGFPATGVFLAMVAVWQGSRARLAELQGLGPGGTVVVPFGLLAVLGLVVLVGRTRRSQPPWSRAFAMVAILAAGGSLTWMIFMWRANVAAPMPAMLLVVGALIINVGWALLSNRPSPWGATAAFVAVNGLILALTFSLAPGFAPIVERPAPSSVVAADRSPNIVLVVLDTVRADHLSLYGYRYETSPRLDEFAAGATIFEPGIANATWSLSSHASLFTGLLPHQHGAHSVITAIRGGAGGSETFSLAQRPLAAEHETIAEFLAARGYHTAAILANFGWLTDFFGLTQGFEYVDNRPMNLFSWEPVAAPFMRRLGRWGLPAINNRYILLSKSAYFADSIVEHVRQWDAGRSDEPFFLVLNFMDAHGPYRASLLGSGRASNLPEIPSAANPYEQMIARYDRSIAFLDSQLGELFAYLDERGVLDDSLVIVTADHGENFSPERRAQHGADLEQSTVGVPMIIKLPGQTEGERAQYAGQLIDVFPTIRDLLGEPQPDDIFGSPSGRSSRAVIAENYFSSLLGAYSTNFVSTEAELEEAFPSRWALFDGSWKLVRLFDGSIELYDLAADPAALIDVTVQNPDVAAAMNVRLIELLAADAFARYKAVAPGALPDERTLETLRSLGYLR